METVLDSEEPARRVFISYSTSDRHRVDGLERLLVLFGHKVFLDFKQIRLGSRWKDEIKRALDQTDITLVYWTRSASSSMWVRNEYEYFLAQYPNRPLVPIVGDETPLAEPLKERQAMTFVPVINELLELKRSMEAEGRKKGEIQASIRKRLEESGIRLEESDVKRIFRFFGIVGWVMWLPAPLVLFEWVWRSIFEAAAQLSRAQVILMFAGAAAAVAITGQVGRNMTVEAEMRAMALANQLEDVRKQYTQLESQAETRAMALANQLEDVRKQYTQLESQAKAREEDLANQLEDVREQYTQFNNRFSSHAVVEVAGIAKPVVLKFIDSTTGRHRFTVLIPSQQDFNFWIPKGSYRTYFALTDISDNMRQLVGGNVERGVIEQTQMESGQVYKIKMVENVGLPIPPEKWGQEGPDDKR